MILDVTSPISEDTFDNNDPVFGGSEAPDVGIVDSVGSLHRYV